MDDRMLSDRGLSAADRRDISEKMTELVNRFQASVTAGVPEYQLINERIAIANGSYSHLVVQTPKIQK